MPCEGRVRLVLPSVKRAIVRVLYEKHHLKQAEIASLLGISQPSVSHFLKGIRGTFIDVLNIDQNITKAIESLSSQLARGEISEEELYEKICQICSMVGEEYLPNKGKKVLTEFSCDRKGVLKVKA